MTIDSSLVRHRSKGFFAGEYHSSNQQLGHQCVHHGSCQRLQILPFMITDMCLRQLSAMGGCKHTVQNECKQTLSQNGLHTVIKH